MSPAPAQLKIGCTKPRAWGAPMGIESMGLGRDGLCLATGMEEAGPCLCSVVNMPRGAAPGTKKGGIEVGSLAEATGVVVSLGTRDRSVGLRKASREEVKRIGNRWSHEGVTGGARSEGGRTAIVTICPA